MPPIDCYKKRYTMRATGQDGANVVVTIPPAFLQREADKHNMTIVQFIRKYKAVAHYNGMDGVLYKFEEVK